DADGNAQDRAPGGEQRKPPGVFPGDSPQVDAAELRGRVASTGRPCRPSARGRAVPAGRSGRYGFLSWYFFSRSRYGSFAPSGSAARAAISAGPFAAAAVVTVAPEAHSARR